MAKAATDTTDLGKGGLRDLSTPVKDSREANWYVIHAKVRSERQAAASIGRLGVEVFLPVVKEEQLVFGYPNLLVKSLFPGYLFARFRTEDWFHAIRYARGVRSVISCGGTPTPVEESIIHCIRGRISDDGFVKIGSWPLLPGQDVVVRDGPLRGLLGVFERTLDGQERVAILLRAVEYQARVLISTSHLKVATMIPCC
jgi:transcription elongation factor/antiterminator RfaH